MDITEKRKMRKKILGRGRRSFVHVFAFGIASLIINNYF